MLALLLRSAGAAAALTGPQLPASVASGPQAPLARLLEFALGICATWILLAVVTLAIGQAFIATLLGEVRTRSMTDDVSGQPCSNRHRRTGRLLPILVVVLAAAFTFGQAGAAGRGLQASGWLDLSYSASSARTTARPLAYNDQVDGPMLQQLWLRLDLPVPEEGGGWGFHSDSIVHGADYRFTRARGLFEGQDGHEGFDPIQFYAERRWAERGLTLKVGRFFSPYAAESVAAPLNVFFSHSHTVAFDPTTHLGALASKADGEWSYALGALAGCDVFIDAANRPMLFAGVTWTEPATAAADVVQAGSILGSSEFDAGRNFNNPNLFDVVWTHPFDSRWTSVLEGLAGWQSGVPGVGAARWKGLVGYLTYAATRKVTPALRLELFDDEHGSRSSFAGKYTAATLGVTWKLSDRLTVRPELRVDRHDSASPWDGSDRLTTLAADVIYRW